METLHIAIYRDPDSSPLVYEQREGETFETFVHRIREAYKGFKYPLDFYTFKERHQPVKIADVATG
jgi:hypothetical protein